MSSITHSMTGSNVSGSLALAALGFVFLDPGFNTRSEFQRAVHWVHFAILHQLLPAVNHVVLLEQFLYLTCSYAQDSSCLN